METKKSIFKREYIILTILVLSILTLVFFNIKVFNSLNYSTKKDQDYLKNQKQLKQNINTIKEEKLALEQQIEALNNIEESISNEREDYYKNIKILEDKIINGESDKKIAYITFDDGPYYLTNKFLEVLKEHNVLATFFTIGLDKDSCYDNRSASCKEMYYNEYHAGHTIANHTYSHLIRSGLYSSVDSFIYQLKLQENLIKERTGYHTNIVRFPGGSATAGHLKNDIINKLKENGYGWVDWTAVDGDGGSLGSAEQAMNNIRNTINEKVEVVLLHDYNYITLSILPDIINYLRNNGYILLPLIYESSMVNK